MSHDTENKGGGFFNKPTRRIVGGAVTIKNTGQSSTHSLGGQSFENVQTGKNTAGHNVAVNPVTRRFRPGTINEETGHRQEKAGAESYHPEFVVGWLVIVEGPGRGMSKPLGYGMNPLGRESKTGVQLDYGDQEISRHDHCQIAYDHKNKKFYIQPGSGQNLTYLGNEPVLTARELYPNASISVGNTTLKFVQFCGDNFEWK
jgi:hypothetical protein